MFSLLDGYFPGQQPAWNCRALTNLGKVFVKNPSGHNEREAAMDSAIMRSLGRLDNDRSRYP